MYVLRFSCVYLIKISQSLMLTEHWRHSKLSRKLPIIIQKCRYIRKCVDCHIRVWMCAFWAGRRLHLSGWCFEGVWSWSGLCHARWDVCCTRRVRRWDGGEERKEVQAVLRNGVKDSNEQALWRSAGLSVNLPFSEWCLVVASVKLSSLVAELSQLPPLRSGMHCLTMSFQWHPSTRSGANWKLFCSDDPTAVSIFGDLIVVLIAKASMKNYSSIYWFQWVFSILGGVVKFACI